MVRSLAKEARRTWMSRYGPGEESQPGRPYKAIRGVERERGRGAEGGKEMYASRGSSQPSPCLLR